MNKEIHLLSEPEIESTIFTALRVAAAEAFKDAKELQTSARALYRQLDDGTLQIAQARLTRERRSTRLAAATALLRTALQGAAGIYERHAVDPKCNKTEQSIFERQADDARRVLIRIDAMTVSIVSADSEED